MQKDILARLDEIRADLRELKQAATKPYNLGDAARYLDITKSHVYQLTCRGLIAHYKPAGKRIYFDKADLDAYLRRNRVASSEEIEQTAESRILASCDRQSKPKVGSDE
ncbi:MAG: helix-turn-helix domain-containing protein [Acidobacteriota bacterium]